MCNTMQNMTNHNRKSREIRMMPSHPDYPQVHYILTLLGMLINPQVHFNTAKFMKQASTFPEIDQTIGEKERKAMIKELKEKLRELFKRKISGLSTYSQFLSELDFDDTEFDEEVFEERLEEFANNLNRIDLE